VAPETLDLEDGFATLVRIEDANHVRFARFKMQIPTAGTCQGVDVGILVQSSRNVVVRSNRLRALGDDTLGDCSLAYGIVILSDLGVGDTASLTNPTSARVTFNTVRDFQYGGILVEGADVDEALVWRNTLRYWHLTESAVPTAEVSGGPCTVNCAFSAPFGIGVERDASAVVKQNHVESGPDACPGCVLIQDLAPTPALYDGIAVTDTWSSADVRVVSNFVRRTVNGVSLFDGAGGAFRRNDVVASSTGFYVDTWEHAVFTGNHATNGDRGILLSPSAIANEIIGNDFLGNADVDCQDLSSGGTGTEGTHNIWTDDHGEPDDPDGICTADDPAP
jgi:hypothetical protein